MVRATLLLTGGNLTSALLSLARNVLIARLVTVEDFGIAATLGITVAMIEMLSGLSLDRLLVQARDGDDPTLQRGLQALQLARGVLAAALLALLSAPYARFVGAPELEWAYRTLALVPLVRGVLHLDMFRLQRVKRFGPSVRVQVIAELAGLAAVLPFYWWFGDWRTMLGTILVQHGTFVALSHLVAISEYRLGVGPGKLVSRAVGFGLPLLANAALIFAILQGDRLIVANQLGLVELGLYSVAFTLAVVPGQVLGKTLQTLFLPRLAAEQDVPARFIAHSRLTIEASLLAGVATALALTVAGPPLLVLLFGGRYASTLTLFVWLALAQGVRIARTGPTIAAVARAQTTNPMWANLVRLCMLPALFAALAAGAGLLAAAWLALVGELLALAASFLLLCRPQVGLGLAGLGLPVGGALGVLGLIGLSVTLWPPVGNPIQHLHIGQALLLVSFALYAALALPALRTKGWPLLQPGRAGR